MCSNEDSQTRSSYGDEKKLVVDCRFMVHPSCVCLKGEIDLRHTRQVPVGLGEIKRTTPASVLLVHSHIQLQSKPISF